MLLGEGTSEIDSMVDRLVPGRARDLAEISWLPDQRHRRRVVREGAALSTRLLAAAIESLELVSSVGDKAVTPLHPGHPGSEDCERNESTACAPHEASMRAPRRAN
jgi:hypothetical protein